MPSAGSGLPFAELAAKVERGMEWLSAHDHNGAFHLWFTSRITPSTPLPAQDEGRREEYAAYYKQRQIWEALWSEMIRREPGEATS
jgi:hypothetical protein